MYARRKCRSCSGQKGGLGSYGTFTDSSGTFELDSQYMGGNSAPTLYGVTAPQGHFFVKRYGSAPFRFVGYQGSVGVEIGEGWTWNGSRAVPPGSSEGVAYVTATEGGPLVYHTEAEAAAQRATEQDQFDAWLRTLARGTIVTSDAAARAREIGVPVSQNQAGQWVVSTTSSGDVLTPEEWTQFATETERARQERLAAEAAGTAGGGADSGLYLGEVEGAGAAGRGWAKWGALAVLGFLGLRALR